MDENPPIRLIPPKRKDLRTDPDWDSWEGIRDAASLLWTKFWEGDLGAKEVHAGLGIVKAQSENLEKRELHALTAKVYEMERRGKVG